MRHPLISTLILAFLTTACGSSPSEPDDSGPIVPLVTLPATFTGDLKLFKDNIEDPELAHWCTGPATFTVSEDDSGSFEIGSVSFDLYSGSSGSSCGKYFPGEGTLTGSWLAPDTLEFHLDRAQCPCNRVYHVEGDVWRAYVSEDTMRFVGLETSGNYRFEYEGSRN